MTYEQLVASLPGFLANTLVAAVSAALCVAVAFLLIQGLKSLSRRGRLPEIVVTVISRWLKWAAVVIAVLLILQSYGLLVNAWAAITAVLGLIAIGFVAVWSVLSNTLCSVLLLILRPFEVGDTIELPTDQVAGKIVNFNMFFTRLQTEKGDHVQVPNNLFFQRAVRCRRGERSIPLGEQLTKDADTP